MTKCNSPTFHKQCSMRGVIQKYKCVILVTGPFAVRRAIAEAAKAMGCHLPCHLKQFRTAPRTLSSCPEAVTRTHVCGCAPETVARTWANALGRAMRPITGTAHFRAPHEVVRRRTTHGLGRRRVSSISPPLDRRWMCRCVTQRGRGVLPSRSRTCELL